MSEPTAADRAQAALDELDAERDALRTRITNALIEHTLTEANGGRPPRIGRALLPPRVRDLIEANAAARADAVMPVIAEEATKIAHRLTSGYELQYRRDQDALMDAAAQEEDLRARVRELEAERDQAQADARSARALAGRYWHNALAAIERRDVEIARLRVAWQSARHRARQQRDALREAMGADRDQVRRTRAPGPPRTNRSTTVSIQQPTPITAEQVERLYSGTIRELDHGDDTLTHDDVINAWIGMPIGPGDAETDGTPAEHMWAEIAEAMTHWHAPAESKETTDV